MYNMLACLCSDVIMVQVHDFPEWNLGFTFHHFTENETESSLSLMDVDNGGI